MGTLTEPKSAHGAVLLALLSSISLAACTSSEVLEPSAIAQSTAPAATTPAPTQSATPAPISPTTSPSPTTTAAIPATARFQFAPVVGTPVEAATPLGERLSQQARAKGFALAAAGDTTSHVLKGYFSALDEGKQSIVVYVWDVLDPAGNRLHRIQGQQPVPGGGGWAAVKPATMQAIADTTIEQLAAWVGRNNG